MYNIMSVHIEGNQKPVFNTYWGEVFGMREAQSILHLMPLYRGRGKKFAAYSNYDLNNQEVTCYDIYYDIPDTVHSVHFQFMEYSSHKVVCKIYYPNVDAFEIVAPDMEDAVEIVTVLRKHYLEGKAERNLKNESRDYPVPA